MQNCNLYLPSLGIAAAHVPELPGEMPHMQDYVVRRLRGIPGLKLPEPEGAFYALPDMSQFFGHGVTADDFGSIPDIDTLCRQVPVIESVKLTCL